MGVENSAYTEPDVITEEDRAIQMGETPSESTEEANPQEGTGTLEAVPPAQETEKPAEPAAATETKTPETLTEEEQKDAESKGLRLETDDVNGRQYLIDEDGEKIPVKRFKALLGEVKDTRRENEELKTKRDLFRQLPLEEYLKIYPDETPNGYKPPEKKISSPVPNNFNVLNLAVTGGQYDGYTLRDVMQDDPDEGTRMLNEWKDNQYEIIRQQDEKASKEKIAMETEALNFYQARVKDLGVEDSKNLTAEQHGKIMALGQEIIAFKAKNNLLNLTFDQAYKLMRHDDLVKDAVQKGMTNAVKGLQKSGPASINTSSSTAAPSEWGAMSEMTEAQLEKHIDGLNDSSMVKFLREAPASIRAKHPGMPWK